MDNQDIRLSLCMIVKNEEKNLARCLDSVKAVVDEIVIIDTGSTDATKTIAGFYTDLIYDFEWQEDFSRARNFAASHARGKWILTMDADDELEAQDKDLLLKLLENDEIEAYFFPVTSFIGGAAGLETVINMNLRLYRNKRDYQYTGRVHEELALNILRAKPEAKMVSRNVRIYHYGYTPKEIKLKEKNSRNRRILELMLEENQEDAFLLFALGNECFVSNDFKSALQLYNGALNKITPDCGYESTLMLRIALSLIELKDYAGGLAMLEEGRAKFPKQTDFMFIKGILLKAQQKHSDAISCFKRCLEIGEAPIAYRFVEGVGTFKSHCCLGDIFYEQGKYDLALEAYTAAVAYQINYERAVEGMIATAIKLSDAVRGAKIVEDLLAPLDIHKAYYLSRAYFKLKAYALALHYIIIVNDEAKGYSSMLLQAKIYFYTGDLQNSIKIIETIEDNEFVDIDFLQLQLMCYLLLEAHVKVPRVLARLKEMDEDHLSYATYNALVALLKEGEVRDFPPTDSSEVWEYTNIIFQILKRLLEIQALDLFKKSVKLLEYVKDPNALLRLGKLYYRFGYPIQAGVEITRSIALYDVSDDEGNRILMEINKEK